MFTGSSLRSLDVSCCPLLVSLNVNDSRVLVDLKGGSRDTLKDIRCKNCPALERIQTIAGVCQEDPGLCAEGSRALNIEVVDSVDQFDLLLRFRVWCRDSRDGCLPGLEMITARLVCVVRMSVLMCCHMSFKGMRPQTVCMN